MTPDAPALADPGEGEAEDYARLFDSWMQYYARRHIVRIGRGVVIMRRAASRPNWFAVDASPMDFSFPCGDDIMTLFELRTLVHALSDSAVLELPPTLGANVRLEQICELVNGAWTTESARLCRIGGLQYVGSVDGTTAALLAQFDGRRRVRDHIATLAASLGTTADAVTPSALAIVRRMMEQGFLQP